MKKGGLDKATAQRILKVWEETGAASPDGLRKMLLGRSLRTVGVVSLQLLLDAGALATHNLLACSMVLSYAHCIKNNHPSDVVRYH